MARRWSRKLTKLFMVAFFVTAIFAGQGGWWYVSPQHEWKIEAPRRHSVNYYDVRDVMNYEFHLVERSSPRFSFHYENSWKFVDAKSGKVILTLPTVSQDSEKVSHQNLIVEADANQAVRYDEQTRELSVYELDQGTLVDTFHLTKDVPDEIESSDFAAGVLCLKDRSGKTWSIDVTTGKITTGTAEADAKQPEDPKSSIDIRLTAKRQLTAHDIASKRLLWQRDFSEFQDAAIEEVNGYVVVWLLVKTGKNEWEETLHDEVELVLQSSDGMEITNQDYLGLSEEYRFKSKRMSETDSFTIGSAPRRIIHTQTPLLYWWDVNRLGAKSYLRFYYIDTSGDGRPRQGMLPSTFELHHLRNLQVVSPTVWFLWKRESETFDIPDRLQRPLDEYAPMMADRLRNRAKLTLGLFDSNDPDNTNQIFKIETYYGAFAMLFDQNRRLAVIDVLKQKSSDPSDESEDDVQMRFRIYDLPLKTAWPLRLFIAMLSSFLFIITVSFLRRRKTNHQSLAFKTLRNNPKI